MDIETLALKLQETMDRSLRNEGRIKKIEQEQSDLRELTKTVAVMAEKVSTIDGSVRELSHKIDTIEAKPAKRWEAIVEKAVLVVVGALVSFLLTKVGMG